MEARIRADITSAQKAGETFRVDTLRLMIAEITNRVIEKRSAKQVEVLTDEDVRGVLQREAKKRREAFEIYTKANRTDLAKKEGDELALIETYLPKMMGRDEVKRIVEEVVAKTGKDFAPAMKEAMARLKGQADGKLVTELVKELTS